ncbi:hypothetical protein F0562_025942 [Nyssa sinensis]|uniref:Uncharacterized protein n=1 Tax=Nyssa sinensis TaxID=561372 RepID=A0A5J5B9W3_9ASTE|nr:hypothetical protein F0562_025942 [Nyssa sinensis]
MDMMVHTLNIGPIEINEEHDVNVANIVDHPSSVSAAEDGSRPQDLVLSKPYQEPEADDTNLQRLESSLADGNQLESSEEATGYRSQDAIMSDAEISSKIEPVKQLFVERTEDYGIPQLERLYTLVVKGVFMIKDTDGEADSGAHAPRARQRHRTTVRGAPCGDHRTAAFFSHRGISNFESHEICIPRRRDSMVLEGPRDRGYGSNLTNGNGFNGSGHTQKFRSGLGHRGRPGVHPQVQHIPNSFKAQNGFSFKAHKRNSFKAQNGFSFKAHKRNSFQAQRGSLL